MLLEGVPNSAGLIGRLRVPFPSLNPQRSNIRDGRIEGVTLADGITEEALHARTSQVERSIVSSSSRREPVRLEEPWEIGQGGSRGDRQRVEHLPES